MRKKGIDAYFDRSITQKGTVNLNALMVESFSKSDFIVVVLTGNYALRANDIPSKCNVTQRTITNLKFFRNIDPIIEIKLSSGLCLKTNILFDTVSRLASLSERTIL